MTTTLLKKRTFCAITGASRGYGRCIAQTLAYHVSDGSTFLLLARNKQQLQDVSGTIQAAQPNITVVWEEFDQANLQNCSLESVQNMLSKHQIDNSKFEQLIVMHNAGTTGDLTKFAHEMTDAAIVEEAMKCNVTGMIVFNSSLLSVFTRQVVPSRVVVNVSSLAALQPFPSWALYCTGKAARDMYFKTLAEEDTSLRVLNYAPGPLDTEMQKKCRECADENLRKVFQDMHSSGKLLKCEDSVTKLVQLLDANSFKSGQHIDYYDV